MNWLRWLGFVALCNGVGFASALAAPAQPLYDQLTKPGWAPPAWLFAPAWTTLYTLMGTATYLIWRRCPPAVRRPALWLFAVQLALNAAWSPVFFGLEAPGAALVLILAIWLAVGALGVAYYRRVWLAGWMILPLFLWVGYATALTAAIWRLSRLPASLG